MFLSALLHKLSALATPDLPLIDRVAKGINEEISKEFSSGANPYGEPWAELLPQTVRRKNGDARILIHTSALADGTVAVPISGTTIQIVSLDRVKYHQATRMVLPTRESLPISWKSVIARESSSKLKRIFG